MNFSIPVGSNACAGIDPRDCAELERAAVKLLDARNIVIKISETLGDATSWAGGKAADFLKKQFDFDVGKKIEEISHELLWNFQSGAMIGLDADSPGDQWGWLHTTIAILSGTTSGFIGAPGLIFDLPITTAIILRSVADIARSFPGENIGADDTKRACIEVFAMGSPLSEDDDAELGYWAARAGLNHATVELLIKSVASQFGVVISEKIMAQALPLAGAIAATGFTHLIEQR